MIKNDSKLSGFVVKMEVINMLDTTYCHNKISGVGFELPTF